MQHARWKVGGAIVALALAFVVGVYTGVNEKITSAASDTLGINLSVSSKERPSLNEFWKAWDILNENFVQTHGSTSLPSEQEKIYGAIAGLTDSYGDPYTVFFPPVQAQIFTESISGEFSGVGMEMDLNKGGELIVVAPLKESPAERAGMRSGDIILAINGTSTQGMTVEKAVTYIRGPKGTDVTLTVRRGAEKPFDVTITRDTIQVPEIKSYKRADGVFVIQLYQFSANSADLFRNALRDFVLSGSHKLVFDLRGNPGGYLEAAVQMASFFLPVGQTIVTEDFNGKQENQVHRSLGYNVFAGEELKMAILIDQGSASASEILAGALQQNNVAVLVGTRSFGKGSVQTLIDVGGGAQLKITIAKWLTPNGSSISDGGLRPDINATTTAEQVAKGQDPQMEAAATYLNK